MGDHLVLCVDRLITPESLQSMQETEAAGSSGEGSSQASDPNACAIGVKEVEEHGCCDEEEPLIQTAECRICQEEDCIKNLETPCACNGSLKVIIVLAYLETYSLKLPISIYSVKQFSLLQ